jgi:hypothetical protein
MYVYIYYYAKRQGISNDAAAWLTQRIEICSLHTDTVTTVTREERLVSLHIAGGCSLHQCILLMAPMELVAVS